MAKKSNQKIKLLYLMKILLENTDDEHGLTLAEISDALGEYGVDAERKTIYDDIDVLTLFGLDIEKRKGRTVTYHVVSRDFDCRSSSSSSTRFSPRALSRTKRATS